MAGPIPLLPEYAAFIDHMIATGRYDSPSDVVMRALSLLRDEEVAREARLDDVDAKLDEGLADIEAGRVHDMDEVFAEIDELIDRVEGARAAAE